MFTWSLLQWNLLGWRDVGDTLVRFDGSRIHVHFLVCKHSSADVLPLTPTGDSLTDLRQQLETSLGTSYSVERELGGGGMSRVFLAEETQLGRKVVIKLLAPEFAEGLSAERFEREIRLAAGLQEPHIVPVIAAGVAAGLPFYTMPFIAGESLRARLSEGQVSVREALSILTDVATALEYAHERGIVHRDIKPENILLSKRSAVVTDFGIAKAIADSRQPWQ